MSRILYCTDAAGISQGYKPVFNSILTRVGIRTNDVLVTSIYPSLKGILKKKAANSQTWVLNQERRGDVERWLESKIKIVQPDVIVTSCPAIVGVITEEGRGADTVELARGGVYWFQGIPVIVTYPPAAVNRRTEDKTGKRGGEVEEDGVTPYKVKSGSFIILYDWARVSRFAQGKQLRVPEFDYSVCRDRTDLDAAVRMLDSAVAIAEDIETLGSPAIISCVGFCGLFPDGRIKSWVIPFADRFSETGAFWEDDEDFAHAIESVRKINANGAIKIMQNGSYDCSYFIRDLMPPNRYLFDTLHAWHSIYPELPKKLNFIASMLLDNFQYWKDDIKGLDNKDGTRKDHSMERYWRYNAQDCYYTLLCAFQLIPLLQNNPQYKHNYENEFLQMLSGLWMSMRGVKADKQRLLDHELRLSDEREVALMRIRKLVDDPQFNPDSPQQKQSLLYDVLGAAKRDEGGKLIGPKSRKNPSAGARAMKLIKSEHPIFKVFCEAIEAAGAPRKQISDICRMPLLTGRFRTAFSAAGTETWRFSSKKSNFWDGSNAQNITKEMRDWLVADEGCFLFDVDYSQSDAVFVAYESNDPKMIETMTCGKDSHSVHASHFFKIPYEDIIKGKKENDPLITDPHTGIRPITKRVAHGANYQMAASTLYATMGKEAVVAAARALGHADAGAWDEARLIHLCGLLLGEYRKLYPRLSRNGWYKEIYEQLKNSGRITNAFGMTRRFMGDPDDPTTQREATAFYGQSDTAGNMNRVLKEIQFGILPERFRDGPNPWFRDKPLVIDSPEYGVEILLQVHDSFVGQVNTRAPRWKEGLNNLLTVMQRPCIINGHVVRVPTEAEIGKRWSSGMIPWRSGDPFDLDRIGVRIAA